MQKKKNKIESSLVKLMLNFNQVDSDKINFIFSKLSSLNQNYQILFEQSDIIEYVNVGVLTAKNLYLKIRKMRDNKETRIYNAFQIYILKDL